MGFERSRVIGVCDKDLDEFTCGICQDIFVDPKETQCCRQIYCKECITQWLEDNTSCPFDRKLLNAQSLRSPSRVVTNLLNNMKVKCDYHLKGCKVVSAMDQLSQHLKSCDKNPNRLCETCGLSRGGAKHDCIANLKIQNQELKDLLEASTRYMKTTIERARHNLDKVHVEYVKNITDLEKDICIDKSKYAINNYDSYEHISGYLANCLTDWIGLQWNAIAFATDGGESLVSTTKYIRLRFDKLRIELFVGVGPSTT